MSTMEESPPDENPIDDPTESSVKEDPLKDASEGDSEPAMLDEEEMPSYVSLASLPVPEDTKPENTDDDCQRDTDPYVNEQDAESVCVLSSGEESDRRPYEMMEDYDTDEMDMEDEEEEDEEEDDSCMNDEDSDGDIEPEQFERSSDDFVLRYDSGLEKHHKERSRSLQDLTNSRGNLSRFVGKRRSIDFMGSYEPEISFQNVQQSLQDPLLIRRKISRSSKYDHVPSKVKLYIQDMKEQRRRSAERANRDNRSSRINFSDVNSRGDSSDVSRAKLNSPSAINNYTQNPINETRERSKKIDDSNYNDRDSTDEREYFSSMNKIEEIKEIDEIEKNQLSDVINESLVLTSENSSKRMKSNGIMNYDVGNDKKIIESTEIIESNGQEEIATIMNPRSLSYEEYANGDETSKPMIENLSMVKEICDNEIVEFSEDKLAVSCDEFQKIAAASTSKKIEKDNKILKILPNEIEQSRSDNWNLREFTFEDSTRRKTMQIDRESYQKTIDENTNLKMELEELRKIVEQNRTNNQQIEINQRTIDENKRMKRELMELRKKFDEYKNEKESIEKKVVSVQTDMEMNEKKIQSNEDETTKEKTSSTNKLLSSSINSALSSIGPWSDSNCSQAISIDPPNMENALNSDDSLAIDGEQSAKTASRPLSHSFITSSRILQTLANITQGRGRTPVQPLITNVTRNNYHLNVEEHQGQSKNQKFHDILTINDEATRSSRAKKRKISDMLGHSSISESFKIPQTPIIEPRRKISSDSAADAAYNSTDERQNPKVNNEKIHKKLDDNTKLRLDDIEDKDNNDTPENVKYFVYHDEPGSEERSFLIQADDSTKNVETLDKCGNVRECGPFLLGNVEIRMSEANGTINIWGKEINQSTENTEIEMDIEDSEGNAKSSFLSKSYVCQSTPQHKCPNANTSGCSLNKRSRISPKFSRSGIGKYLRTAATNFSKNNVPLDNTEHSGCCGSKSTSYDNDRIYNCEHCEFHRKRTQIPSCEHLANLRRIKHQQHSCCLHNVEINERDYNCISDNDVFDDSTIYETMSNIIGNHGKFNNLLNNSANSKHFCVNRTNEEIHRNHSSPCRRASGHEEDFHQTKKRWSSCNDSLPTCGTRLIPGGAHNHRDNDHSQCHVSCEDDDRPLLSSDENCETPETKRRRLSGKKVRGILTDLLRGCSGCRETNNSTSSLPRANAQNIPKVHVTPCSPNQASCSKRTGSSRLNQTSNDLVTEKCCNPCTRHAEMRAQIENQLEIFRVSMEHLRSRSDTVLEMLHLLNAEAD